MKIDVAESEVTIKKTRRELWSAQHIRDFNRYNHLFLNSYNTTEKLISYLRKGEPVMIYYKFPLRNGRWVGHFVAAYSFDANGVWVSETVSNTHKHLPWSTVLKPEDPSLTYGRFSTVFNSQLQANMDRKENAPPGKIIYRFTYGPISVTRRQSQ